jgi:beta-phosphoglucomutase
VGSLESHNRGVQRCLPRSNPLCFGDRVQVRGKLPDELPRGEVDFGKDNIRRYAARPRPFRPCGPNRGHGVDEDAIEVEDDGARVDMPLLKAGQLQAVIFDMDGVLVISEPPLAEAAIELFAEKGHAVTADDFKPFIGMGEDRYIGGVAERLGIELDAERDKARLYEIYARVIRGRLQPLPGAIAFVHECRGRGLAVAVASGADRIKVVANLEEIGLPESLFDAVVDANQVVRKKPAPDVFLEACRRLGVPPAACLVIEDAVSGVRAAKAAGMRCLGITTSFDARELAGADWIAPDLAHVPSQALSW